MSKTNTWDAKPQYKTLHGQTTEMFYRSHLAKALNREIGTIRSMERKGYSAPPA